MPEGSTETHARTVQGMVVDVDYDADTITVELEGGVQQRYPFETFDSHDVYQVGQRFELTLGDVGQVDGVSGVDVAETELTTVSGYVESVDQDDELVWVYIRGPEGWQRKVMPLSLFQESDLARPGVHFLLELDENGTPLGLRPDEAELEMLPLKAEETKPRWTNRPAAEAEPES